MTQFPFFVITIFFFRIPNLSMISLWHMELFSVFKICIESVCYAIKILDALKNGTKIDKGNIMPMGK